jgi:hypothetical protein
LARLRSLSRDLSDDVVWRQAGLFVLLVVVLTTLRMFRRHERDDTTEAVVCSQIDAVDRRPIAAVRMQCAMRLDRSLAD